MIIKKLAIAICLILGFSATAAYAASGQQCVQNTLYQAVASVSGGDGNKAAAYLGTFQSETNCAGTIGGGKSSCDGRVDQKTTVCDTCSAYGIGQFTKGTWTSLVNANKGNLQRDLGGCAAVNGAAPAGSLLDPKVTPDGIVRGQFKAFLGSLCGVSSPAPTDHQYWSGMVGIGVLMTKYHDAGTVNKYGNSSVAGTLQSQGLSSTSVISYLGHMGGGHAQNILNAVQNGQGNASIASVDKTAASCNPGLFCTGPVTKDTSYPCNTRCSSYKTVNEALKGINDKVANPNSECLKEGLASISGQLKTQPGALSGTGAASSGTGYTGVGTDLSEGQKELELTGGGIGDFVANAPCENGVTECDEACKRACSVDK